MSDEIAGTGRARGKARGRARPQTSQDTTRRPGHEQSQMQAAAPPPVAPQLGPNGGGRRTHRGAPRMDAPSEGVQGVSEGLQQMHLESGRGRSREAPSYAGGDVHTRPANFNKKGQSGKSIWIVANYFELLQRPNWAIHQYSVEFAPVVESTRMMRAFMRDHKETLGSCYLFDGRSDLKTLTKLPDNTELYSTRKTDEAKIRISFKYTAELSPQHPELKRLFNTQMRRNLEHMRYQLLGRHYFDQSAISDIPQFHLKIWQGVVTSIRQQEEKLMMLVDTVHKVVRDETALQIIKKLLENNPRDYKESIARELVGCVIMTRYNNRTYSVEDIDWSLNPTKTFESKEGPITYGDYYKKQYDIVIKDLLQPLLLCKSKEREIRSGASANKKIYIVPELSVMTGITDSMRANYNLLREMAVHTRLGPTERVSNLHLFISRMNQNETVRQELGAWGLKFSDQLVKLQGRILPDESIVCQDRKLAYKSDTGDFGRELRNQPQHVAKSLDEWVLVVTSGRDESAARDFLANLLKVCPPMGMKVRSPKIVTIPQDRVNLYIQNFRDHYTPSTQLVCFVVPNNKKERYDALKKYTCFTCPVPSQVIVSRTLAKKQMLMSVATKIGIQINAKLGGEPWTIANPLKAAMVIGFDTYHDSAKKGNSAGGFVASLNPTLSRWYSNVTFHSRGGWEEISNHVNLNVTQALKKYFEVNGRYPEMIFYYRDGVGDGQVPYVLEWEVKPLEKTLQANAGSKGIKFAFIIVNKRINSRFFYQSNANQYINPPPGTLIDNTVTCYDRYDFYLISQSVRQGTVGPTMYNVIKDTTSIQPEYMQRFTYKLTHLYYNWQGTIRVPAPCQYSHKLAFLAGQSLHQPPHEALSDKLFFL